MSGDGKFLGIKTKNVAQLSVMQFNLGQSVSQSYSYLVIIRDSSISFLRIFTHSFLRE